VNVVGARILPAVAGAAALAALSGCGASAHHGPTSARAQTRHVAIQRGQRSQAVSEELRTALPAFRRPPRATDTWTGSVRRLDTIRASRRVATLDTPPGRLSLFLLATASGTCLELTGLGGDCNDAANFFGRSPFELIDADPVVAAILASRVARVSLSTPTRTLPLPIDSDRAFIFRCPMRAGRRSCAGDQLLGVDRRGNLLFGVRL
jgi:hypothetical protein